MSQIDFPFACNPAKLQEFLNRWCLFEEEEDRLREEKRLLKQAYADAIPLRAVLVAVKVVRAQHKLEQHPKEPMPRVSQALLEHAVAEHLLAAEYLLAAAHRLATEHLLGAKQYAAAVTELTQAGQSPLYGHGGAYVRSAHDSLQDTQGSSEGSDYAQ